MVLTHHCSSLLLHQTFLSPRKSALSSSASVDPVTEWKEMNKNSDTPLYLRRHILGASVPLNMTERDSVHRGGVSLDEARRGLLDKPCVLLCSVAVINTVIRSNLERKGFISVYSYSLPSKEARAGARSRNQGGTLLDGERMFLFLFCCCFLIKKKMASQITHTL